jgi:CHAT domain-containing protein/tetratricopeptide (TPR) repeat protein
MFVKLNSDMRKIFSILHLLLIIVSSASGQFKSLNKMMRRGDFAGALTFAEKRIASVDKKKSRKYRVQTFHLTLGRIHYILGDYTRAENELKTSLQDVNMKIESKKRLTLRDFDVIDELALFYVHTGNFQRARELIDRSLTLRVKKLKKNDPTNFRPYLPLGMLFFFQNRPDSARHYLGIYQKQIRNSNYTGFLDINRYADTYQILAEIEMSTGRYAEAKKFAKKSARLQRHPWTKKQVGKNYLGRVRALNTLSDAYHLNNKMLKAVRYNRKALALYSRKYDRENYVLVPVYISKARLSAAENKIDTVRKYLQKTIGLQLDFIRSGFSHLSEYEKENYYARLRNSFHEINSVMIRLFDQKKVSKNDPFWSSILNYAIQTKALILNETNRLLENMRVHSDPETRNLFLEWRRLKNEWAYLAGNTKRKSRITLDTIQNQINDIEKKLIVKNQFAGETSLLSDWRQVQSSLNPNEAAIELARIQKKGIKNDTSVVYLAFVITREANLPEVVVLPNGKDLEQRYIRYYFNAIDQRIRDTVSFSRFWKPLAEKLPGVKTIYISADGIFHLINADALRDEKTDRFLADDLSFINVTNISQAVSHEYADFSFASAGLFGAPDFSGYTFAEKQDIGFREIISPLPGTDAEVRQIGRLLDSHAITIELFTGKDASERQLSEQQSFDVLHLATHGFFNSTAYGRDAMLGSGLLLAKDKTGEKDGILTAYEASGLNLDRTRLVVLSACKTGLGQVKEGEGVYGLQRAFEVAGVDYILMTLWNVDDRVTKEFMIDFYAHLIRTKNVHQAFRQAQLRLKTNYPEVYYWGAFKLISSIPGQGQH